MPNGDQFHPTDKPQQKSDQQDGAQYAHDIAEARQKSYADRAYRPGISDVQPTSILTDAGAKDTPEVAWKEGGEKSKQDGGEIPSWVRTSASKKFELVGALKDSSREHEPTWPVDLSDPDAVQGIIRPNVQGADSIQLQEVMRSLNRLSRGLPPTFEGAQDMRKLMPEDLVQGETLQDLRDQAALLASLSTLAEIRGVSLEVLQADYKKMIELRVRAADLGNARYGAVDALSESSPFWGSVNQLRFGKIVGDAFGIDPVFGSLLSPTGGMIGSGESSLDNWIEKPAVHIHGGVHDAAGYLYRYHGIGPGYQYVPDTIPVLDRDNPLGGQVDGIRFWKEQLEIRRQ